MFRKITVAVVHAMLLGLAACGDGGDVAMPRTTGEAIAALRAAPDAAAEARSARFELTLSAASEEGAFDLFATGAYDGAQMAMAMDFGSALAELAEGSGETVPEGFDEPMEIVTDGTRAYVRVPMLDAVTGDGGWFSAGIEELTDSGGSLGLAEGTSDPAQFLEMLRGVTDDLREVGSEDVRDVATTHFTATVDVVEAVRAAPPAQRQALEEHMGGFDVAELPLDVWVDAAGLVRRVVLDLEATATLTIEFFDYGEDVDIEVPAADAVTPLGEVMGRAV